MNSAAHPEPVLADISATVKPPRLDSVDFVRGLVMIVMALDHTRDFFSISHFPPEILPLTTGPLFFTRFITHFCAPTFFLLAGTGIFLSATRGKTPSELSRFLITRGLWLVFCELFIVSTGMAFIPFPFFGQTIWALGWSMVLMSAIIRLPMRWVAVFGLVMVFTHNLFDTVMPWQLGSFSALWTVLHVDGFITLHGAIWQVTNGHLNQTLPTVPFVVVYPLIPWVGVMACGYAMGTWMLKSAEPRRKLLLWTGIGMTLLFVGLRATNFYGSLPEEFTFIPTPAFAVQKTLTMTLISFFDTTKYPPSLQFLLMTLGPILILLSWTDRWDFAASGGLARLRNAIVIYGRVPMFFYLIHFYLIHVLAVVLAMLTHQPWKWLFMGGFFMNRIPNEYGFSLPIVYAIWMFVVISMYPACKWFAGVKKRRKDWWLSYL